MSTFLLQNAKFLWISLSVNVSGGVQPKYPVGTKSFGLFDEDAPNDRISANPGLPGKRPLKQCVCMFIYFVNLQVQP